MEDGLDDAVPTPGKADGGVQVPEFQLTSRGVQSPDYLSASRGGFRKVAMVYDEAGAPNDKTGNPPADSSTSSPITGTANVGQEFTTFLVKPKTQTKVNPAASSAGHAEKPSDQLNPKQYSQNSPSPLLSSRSASSPIGGSHGGGYLSPSHIRLQPVV